MQRGLPFGTDGHSARGGRYSPKAVVINRVRDYRALEREFITTDFSIRELCRRHDITAHSAVVVQARKGDWEKKCEAYRAKASESFIENHAERMAARQAEIHDEVLEPSLRPSPSSGPT